MTLPNAKHSWNFNEGSSSTVVDKIGGSIITIVNRRSGPEGRGLALDPKSGATSVESDLQDIPMPWSLSVWVFRDASSVCSTLFASSQYALRLEQWSTDHSVGVTHFGKFDHDFGYQVPLKQWVHLMFVGNTVDTKLYVDGKLKGVLRTPLGLGVAWIGSDDGFTGRGSLAMDDLTIWAQALTDDQVLEVYNVSSGAGIHVTVDGQSAANGGAKDLGEIALGQAKAAQIAVKIGGPGTLTYTFEGSELTFAVPSESTYTLTLKPTRAGRAEAKIAVKSEDPAIPVFNYTIHATGKDENAADLQVLWSSTQVVNARTYDIGSIALGSSPPFELPLLIKNAGKAQVTYSLSGSDQYGFWQVPKQSGRALSGGASDSHPIRFTPSRAGRWAVLVHITSDDPRFQSFYFWLTATVTP